MLPATGIDRQPEPERTNIVNTYSSILEAALDYHQRLGWKVIKVNGKNPSCMGAAWEARPTTEEDIRSWFGNGLIYNLGVQWGSASKDAGDVDLDTQAAVLVADSFLKLTTMVYGRPKHLRSHRIYRILDGPGKNIKLEDPILKKAGNDRAVIVELRCNNLMTVVPPSIHEKTKEVIAWDVFEEATPATYAELARAVHKIGAAALLARYWPAEGARHSRALELGGALAHAGYPVEDAEHLVRAIAHATKNDDEVEDRVRAVRDSYDNLAKKEPVSGWPTLVRSWGKDKEPVLQSVWKWLGIERKAGADQEPPGGCATPQRKLRYCPLPPFIPFPVDALPPVIKNMVVDGANAIGCDTALLAPHALAAAGGAIGNSFAVRLKRTWVESAVIWAATVMASGTRKTPAWRLIVNPLAKIQAQNSITYREQRETFNAELRRWKSRDKAERGLEPEPPERPGAFYTSDATIEAISRILGHKCHGLLVGSDELDGWFKSFTRYKGQKGESDRSKWLQMHAANVLVVDRAKDGEDGSLAVPHAGVSICGTIQPGTLARALDADSLEAGLGARLMLTAPDERHGSWTEKDVSAELYTCYKNLLRHLLNLPLADARMRKAYILDLTPDAKKAWIKFYDEWAVVKFEAEGALKASFAKLEAYAIRLALIHHVISTVCAKVTDRVPVTLKSMEAGITMARWFAYEATRIYTMLGEDKEDNKVRILVEWIQRQGGRTTVKKLQRSNSRRYPHRDDAQAALDGLVQAGIGQWEEGSKPTKGGWLVSWFSLVRPSDSSDPRFDDPDEDDEDLYDPPSDPRFYGSDDQEDQDNGTRQPEKDCGEQTSPAQNRGSEGSDGRTDKKQENEVAAAGQSTGPENRGSDALCDGPLPDLADEPLPEPSNEPLPDLVDEPPDEPSILTGP
jgi:hypothetical protein